MLPNPGQWWKCSVIAQSNMEANSYKQLLNTWKGCSAAEKQFLILTLIKYL